MRRLYLIITLSVLLLSGCAQGDDGPSLTVSIGENKYSYTVSQLEAIDRVEAIRDEISYVGVPLVKLLENAGIDTASLSMVQAVASDGFTVEYESEIFLDENNIVAYAQVDGTLAEDELPFRMVIPDGTGKVNLRMLIEIIAIP